MQSTKNFKTFINYSPLNQIHPQNIHLSPPPLFRQRQIQAYWN